MAETVSLKVCLKNSGETSDSDVRRFAVDRELSTKFAALVEKLTTIFPCLHKKTFSITWIDKENDTITLSTDEELTIALSEMSGPVYKLNVQVTGEEKKSAGRNTDGEAHPGVMCDGCERDLVGFRYKCLACPDFDLCGDCESAGLHPEHRMIRIARPGQKFCPKFGRNVRGNQRNASQRPCHVPMTGHMTWNQQSGFLGFLEGLQKMAGDQGNLGSCSRGEKPCNKAKSEEKDVKIVKENEEVKNNPGEEKNEGKEENKDNSEQSPTEKMVKNFLEAAVGCLGDDVKPPSKDIENVGKLVSDIMSMFNVEIDINEQNKESKDETNEQQESSEPSNDDEPEKQKSSSSSDDDEEWTIVKDDSRDQTPTNNIYPTLDTLVESTSSEVVPQVSSSPHSSPLPSSTSNTTPQSTTSTTLPSSVSGATASSPDTTSVTNTTPCLPSAPAIVTDPKIQVALQAMINMGFTNEGGWLQNLLEAKEGDIGKVLDIIKPNNK